jgi:hypothetical protein
VYRLSERYPLINQAIGDSTLLPEFDNLYLDMNGIIHNATHKDSDGVSKKKGEDEVVKAMIAYIDKIVKIVKPTSLLYLAIDGVAPRAKMNQQRSRRFRAARDGAEAKEQARLAGQEVKDDEVWCVLCALVGEPGSDVAWRARRQVFDSNCITPGTHFMSEVSRHLKYFIRKKIKEDTMWQRLHVVFSGHEVRCAAARPDAVVGARRGVSPQLCTCAWCARAAGSRRRRAQDHGLHPVHEEPAGVQPQHAALHGGPRRRSHHACARDARATLLAAARADRLWRVQAPAARPSAAVEGQHR